MPVRSRFCHRRAPPVCHSPPDGDDDEPESLEEEPDEPESGEPESEALSGLQPGPGWLGSDDMPSPPGRRAVPRDDRASPTTSTTSMKIPKMTISAVGGPGGSGGLSGTAAR
jgi:hypothetical protein